jgi:hypothetical protein
MESLSLSMLARAILMESLRHTLFQVLIVSSLDVKGILIDFWWTLAYIDPAGDQRYREALQRVLANHGATHSFSDMSAILDETSRRSRKGEVHDMMAFWRSFLQNLRIPATPALIADLRVSTSPSNDGMPTLRRRPLRLIRLEGEVQVSVGV